MKYVLEDFFKLVTPRITDAGTFDKNGDVWLMVSSPFDTKGEGSVIISYNGTTQIITSINITSWSKKNESEDIIIWYQNDDYAYLKDTVDIVNWNDIIDLCREYVNVGGLRG
jgi:hypothetical protein